MKTLNKTYHEDLVLSETIYQSLETFIGKHPAERGVMLGRDEDGVVRHCAWDTGAICNGAEYNPDTETLNKVIKSWEAQNIEFVGFVHSHPHGVRQPSLADIHYSADILGCFKSLEHMWLPIIQTKPNSGKFEIIPYVAVPNKSRKSCHVLSTNLVIEKEKTKPSTVLENPKVSLLKSTPQKSTTKAEPEEQLIGILANASSNTYLGNMPFRKVRLNQVGEKAVDQAQKQYQLYFQRQEKDFDLQLLADTRLVIIGTGGAASLVESCARMGYGEFVLIDPDVIAESNVATQMVSPDDIGKYKVDALAERIIAINPLAVVQTIPKEIETLKDERVDALLTGSLKVEECGVYSDVFCSASRLVKPKQPKQTILMVLTDSFEAQARGHRIGLNAGISTICAQAYTKGVGAEITYTVPDVTSACHRCMTSSRYRGYLEEGYKNAVASAGSPIFAADYLNASIGHILLAVTHHGTEHPIWGNVIKSRGNRNLIMLKMNPCFADTLGFDLVSNAAEGGKDSGAFSMLNAVSLPQTPDCGQNKRRPICPDCGGTGNLQAQKGCLTDTCVMHVA